MINKRYLITNAMRFLAFIAVAMVFVERPLQAYADPGSGLLVWQLLGAIVIGAFYQVRRLVSKLRSSVMLSEKRQDQGSEASNRGIFLS